VKPIDILALLTEFHREKLTLRQRHAAVARQVSNYSFNNTYQYVIAREDVHLAWLETAIADLGGTPADVAEPELASVGKSSAKKKDLFAPLVRQDAQEAEAFVACWRPRIAEVSHARHRTMLQVILGETLEHKRFFDQIVSGRDDVLGRRADGAGTGDNVLGVRWLGDR